MLEDQTVKILTVVSSVVTPVLVLLIGFIVNWIRRDVATCVEDTKGCNRSIASLAERSAITDTKVTLMSKRMDGFSESFHDLHTSVTELKTEVKIRKMLSRGND